MGARSDVLDPCGECRRYPRDRGVRQAGPGPIPSPSTGSAALTAYLLIYSGRSYDSKAILGVAYKLATACDSVRMISVVECTAPPKCSVISALRSVMYGIQLDRNELSR